MTIDRWKLITGAGIALAVIAGLVFALLSSSESDEPGSSAPTVAQPSDAESPDAVENGSTTTPWQDSTDGPTDLESSLRTLGVDISPSDRVAPNQEFEVINFWVP